MLLMDTGEGLIEAIEVKFLLRIVQESHTVVQCVRSVAAFLLLALVVCSTCTFDRLGMKQD